MEAGQELSKGQKLVVTVDAIGKQGDFLAHFKRIVIIVKAHDLNIGEKLEIEITEVKPTFAFAKKTEAVKAEG